MISETEVKILEFLNSHLLVRNEEIRSAFGNGANGIETSLQRLASMDCIKTIEPIGEKCFVITQKGSRLLREAKNPERRPHDSGMLSNAR